MEKKQEGKFREMISNFSIKQPNITIENNKEKE